MDRQGINDCRSCKSDTSWFGVLDKDDKTVHAQWRHKEVGEKKLLALASDHAHFGHYNNLVVKNIEKN